MSEQSDDQTTEPLPQPILETRVTALENNAAAQHAMLNQIDGKLDLLIKLQQDMYVDLRKRIADLNEPLSALATTVNQIQRDIQPDSFQNRLMRMGQ